MKKDKQTEIAKKIIKLLDGQTELNCKLILRFVNEKLDSLSALNANLASTVLFPQQP
jgi:hypothetical protein